MKLEHLKQKYPLLLPGDEREPILLFGIECDAGWDNLLEATCELLYSRYNRARSNYEFWSKKATQTQSDSFYSEERIKKECAEAYKQMTEEAKQMATIEQIKEKFGTLRFYATTTQDYDRGVIDLAESLSETTCEVCGNRGKLYSARWWKTLCLSHAEERGYLTKEPNEKSSEP